MDNNKGGNMVKHNFTVYAGTAADDKTQGFYYKAEALSYAQKLAAQGIMSEVRDANFDHVATFGER